MFLVILIGCSTEAPNPGTSVATTLGSEQVSPLEAELQASLTKIINDAEFRYLPLDYDYDEDLLEKMDKVEAALSGKGSWPEPRLLTRLDEAEERDHFRVTLERWSAKTGRDFREAIEPLKAEVAQRSADGPRNHPDFHKRFSEIFDDFIAIEVAEIRERRNKAIHQAAQAAFESARKDAPEIVAGLEKTLNQPPYNLTSGSE